MEFHSYNTTNKPIKTIRKYQPVPPAERRVRGISLAVVVLVKITIGFQTGPNGAKDAFLGVAVHEIFDEIVHFFEVSV